jgi:hypothetical protein
MKSLGLSVVNIWKYVNNIYHFIPLIILNIPLCRQQPWSNGEPAFTPCKLIANKYVQGEGSY